MSGERNARASEVAHTPGPRSLTILAGRNQGEDRMIDILVIQIAVGLVIVAAVAATGLIVWRRGDGRSEKI